MPNRVTFISVADPRGDLDFVAKVISLAQQNDVPVQGLFFFGNFVGSLLAKPELSSLDEARRALRHEHLTNESYYKEEGVLNLWDLIQHMSQHSERYRRGTEVGALQCYKQLLGRRDDSGHDRHAAVLSVPRSSNKSQEPEPSDGATVQPARPA